MTTRAVYAFGMLGAGLVLLPRPGAAQEPDLSPRVDSLVAAEMKVQHVPGVSVAVVRNGQVILARGYGIANIEHQVPVKPETIFQSGSIGKQFTPRW